MRNLLLFAVLFVSARMVAQPVLAHNWPTGVNRICTSSGPKFYVSSDTSVTIYNEDYTVNTSFSLNYPQHVEKYGITQLLPPGVVTNDDQYTYIVNWYDTATHNGFNGYGLYKQDGTSLLGSDSFNLYIEAPYLLPQGSTAELEATYNVGPNYQQMNIYSLAGCLPVCNYGCGTVGITGPRGTDAGSLEAYPVPSSGQINLNYHLPDGVASGNIVLYSINGQEVKRTSVSNQSGLITDRPDVASGTYFYQLTTTAGSTIRKIIFIP